MTNLSSVICVVSGGARIPSPPHVVKTVVIKFYFVALSILHHNFGINLSLMSELKVRIETSILSLLNTTPGAL